MSRITDANIDAFLDEDPKNFWCGRVETARTKFRWTEKIARR